MSCRASPQVVIGVTDLSQNFTLALQITAFKTVMNGQVRTCRAKVIVLGWSGAGPADASECNWSGRRLDVHFNFCRHTQNVSKDYALADMTCRILKPKVLEPS